MTDSSGPRSAAQAKKINGTVEVEKRAENKLTNTLREVRAKIRLLQGEAQSDPVEDLVVELRSDVALCSQRIEDDERKRITIAARVQVPWPPPSSGWLLASGVILSPHPQDSMFCYRQHGLRLRLCAGPARCARRQGRSDERRPRPIRADQSHG